MNSTTTTTTVCLRPFLYVKYASLGGLIIRDWAWYKHFDFGSIIIWGINPTPFFMGTMNLMSAMITLLLAIELPDNIALLAINDHQMCKALRNMQSRKSSREFARKAVQLLCYWDHSTYQYACWARRGQYLRKSRSSKDLDGKESNWSISEGSLDEKLSIFIKCWYDTQLVNEIHFLQSHHGSQVIWEKNRHRKLPCTMAWRESETFWASNNILLFRLEFAKGTITQVQCVPHNLPRGGRDPLAKSYI